MLTNIPIFIGLILAISVLFYSQLLYLNAFLLPPEYVAMSYIFYIYSRREQFVRLPRKSVLIAIVLMILSIVLISTNVNIFKYLCLIPIGIDFLKQPSRCLALGAFIFTLYAGFWNLFPESAPFTDNTFSVIATLIGYEYTYSRNWFSESVYPNIESYEKETGIPIDLELGYLNGLIPGFIHPFTVPDTTASMLSELVVFVVLGLVKVSGKSIFTEIISINYDRATAYPLALVTMLLAVLIIKTITKYNIEIPVLKTASLHYAFIIGGIIITGTSGWIVIISLVFGMIMGLTSSKTFLSWLIISGPIYSLFL